MTNQNEEPLEEHVFDSEQNALPDKTKLIVFIACAVLLYAIFYIIQAQSWRYTLHHFSSPVINIYSLAPKLVIPGLIASFACAVAADGFGLNRLIIYIGTLFTLLTVSITWFVPEYFHSKIPYFLSVGPSILSMMLVSLLGRIFFPEGKINMMMISIFYFSGQIFPLIVSYLFAYHHMYAFPGSVFTGVIILSMLMAGIAVLDVYVFKGKKIPSAFIPWTALIRAIALLAIPVILGELVFSFTGSVLINLIHPHQQTWHGWIVPLLVYAGLAGIIFLLSLKFRIFSPHWLTGFSFFFLCIFLFLALVFPWLALTGSLVLLIIHHLMASLFKLGVLGWALKFNEGKNPGVAYSLIGLFHIASVYLTSILITPEKLIGKHAGEYIYILSYSILVLSFFCFLGFLVAARNETEQELSDPSS